MISDAVYTGHTWTNAQFRAALHQNATPFNALTEYATERDTYLYPPAPSPGTTTRAFADFAEEVQSTLAAIRTVPSLEERLVGSGLKEVSLGDGDVTLSAGGVQLSISNTTGEIVSLTTSLSSRGGAGHGSGSDRRGEGGVMRWADAEHRIGGFVYRTFTQDKDLDR